MTDLRNDEAEGRTDAEPGDDDILAELGDLEPADGDADDVRGGGLVPNHSETLVLDAG